MSGAVKNPNPFENLGPDEIDVSAFQPRTISIRTDGPDQRDRQKSLVADLAIENGFKINNNEEAPIKASRRATGIKTFLKTMRIQVGDYNKFQRWCNENGYSQQEGFNLLVTHIPKKKA
jgi:hypothetical protein